MTAWMIKNDGTEIPVVTHWYADDDEIDEVTPKQAIHTSRNTGQNRKMSYPIALFIDNSCGILPA